MDRRQLKLALVYQLGPAKAINYYYAQGQKISFRLECDPSTLMEQLQLQGIWWVTDEDEEYPAALRELHQPPLLLFGQGDKQVLKKPMISVIGSRKGTEYGRQVAVQVSNQLAARGYVVVSGLAYGIDSFAHQGALRSGLTIAVLGNGLGRIYPAANRSLAEKIINRGCLLSEFWPGTEPKPWHFPMRNRIIAGLGQKLIVVEAAENSGTLITVDYALELGREVWAVPGPITSIYSKGTNNLIKQGAMPFCDLEDLDLPPVKENTADSELPTRILSLINRGFTDAVALARELNLNLDIVMAELTRMELRGQVIRFGNNFWA